MIGERSETLGSPGWRRRAKALKHGLCGWKRDREIIRLRWLIPIIDLIDTFKEKRKMSPARPVAAPGPDRSPPVGGRSIYYEYAFEPGPFTGRGRRASDTRACRSGWSILQLDPRLR
jgi:hypothetical protein